MNGSEHNNDNVLSEKDILMLAGKTGFWVVILFRIMDCFYGCFEDDHDLSLIHI